MKVLDTNLPDVKIIEPRIFGDQRGFFYESYNLLRFREILGIDAEFVQDNHSKSARGVLRGLHYQIRQAQAKLVRVVSGSVYDVAVDLRRSSPNFGNWTGTVLSAENFRQMWIPAGFAHGFLVLEDDTEFLYKTSDYYAPEHERTLQWNAPELAIDWPLDDLEPILSPKDEQGTGFANAECFP